uniref:Dynein heavy chain tail domain-containing protein n=1 Tax=Cacopsylla melanoneura TaxID=428564 RepID=A0A8D8TEK2_9HEMI
MEHVDIVVKLTGNLNEMVSKRSHTFPAKSHLMTPPAKSHLMTPPAKSYLMTAPSKEAQVELLVNDEHLEDTESEDTDSILEELGSTNSDFPINLGLDVKYGDVKSVVRQKPIESTVNRKTPGNIASASGKALKEEATVKSHDFDIKQTKDGKVKNDTWFEFEEEEFELHMHFGAISPVFMKKLYEKGNDYYLVFTRTTLGSPINSDYQALMPRHFKIRTFHYSNFYQEMKNSLELIYKPLLEAWFFDPLALENVDYPTLPEPPCVESTSAAATPFDYSLNITKQEKKKGILVPQILNDDLSREYCERAYNRCLCQIAEIKLQWKASGKSPAKVPVPKDTYSVKGRILQSIDNLIGVLDKVITYKTHDRLLAMPNIPEFTRSPVDTKACSKDPQIVETLIKYCKQWIGTIDTVLMEGETLNSITTTRPSVDITHWKTHLNTLRLLAHELCCRTTAYTLLILTRLKHKLVSDFKRSLKRLEKRIKEVETKLEKLKELEPLFTMLDSDVMDFAPLRVELVDFFDKLQTLSTEVEQYRTPIQRTYLLRRINVALITKMKRAIDPKLIFGF